MTDSITGFCTALDPNSGVCLGHHTAFDDLLLGPGRCRSRLSQGFQSLNWIGGHSRWLLQRLPEELQSHRHIAEVSLGNYLAIGKDGHLCDPNDKNRFNTLNQELDAAKIGLAFFREVSADGNLVEIAARRGDPSRLRQEMERRLRRSAESEETRDFETIIVDLQLNRIVPAKALAPLEYERAFKVVRQHAPHFRFSSIATDAAQILLKDSNDAILRVFYENNQQTIRMDGVTHSNASYEFIEFKEVSSKTSRQQQMPDLKRPGSVESVDKYSVMLDTAGPNKIEMIRTIRNVNCLGLKEAKDLVESAPKLVKQRMSHEAAEKLRAEIVALGGSCSIILSRDPENKHAPDAKSTLWKAEWASGSKAWLDSRGLMHLKSANKVHPEITLALRDGTLSGWLSSGAVFGDDYYCGNDPSAFGLPRIKPHVAWESALRPFIESVPWNFLFTSDTAQTGSTVLPGY